MKKEFNLSEKIFGETIKLIEAKEVKEFIKRLKEELSCRINYATVMGNKEVINIIDKLAGDKLIGEKGK